MTLLSVDIETIPDPEKIDLFNLLVKPTSEEKAKPDFNEDDWRRLQMSVTPEYCLILGMNLMSENQNPVSRWVGEEYESSLTPGKILKTTEAGLLKLFWKLAKENSTLITYNGIAFDLEAIKFRSAQLAIEPLANLLDLKPWENRVIDLMKKLYTNRKPMGLKKLRQNIWSKLVEIDARMLDYQDLLEMEGGSVYELFQQGKLDILKRYGEFDALTNMAIYKWGKGYWW